ncbi:hypothetical protein PG995_003643 [Apiospora arundinis]
MSTYRTGGGGRPRDYDDRDYYPAPPRGGRDYDDVDVYERREERRSAAPVRDYQDTEISIRERDSRTPAFLRDEGRRNEAAGPLVLRAREIETVDRRRPRSPSPPPAVHVHERFIERERERSPAPPSMAMERRPRFMEESDRHLLAPWFVSIIAKWERIPSPSPSPPPPPAPPAVIRGPTIEREVITHYRDIDHGVIKVPSPPPPAPAPRPSRTTERETDIDIYTRGNETEVDIHKRMRSRSRPRERPRPQPPAKQPSYYDDEVLVQSSRKGLHVDIDHSHRRSHSAAPERRPDYSDEADYITNKIDSRGRMGEAWNGATKDWSIIDVPPGTERVKMDGIGGGSAEVTWQRYNGVRRSKFVPERDGTVVSSSSVNESASDRDRLSVQVYDSHRDKSRERDYVEDVHDTRISIRDRERRPRKKEQEMWTEITKDLVVREAIEKCGYEYEETEWFFYVMQYLRYEDVSELVSISDQIRRARRERAREIEWERESRDRWERRHRHRRSMGKFDDERIVEHEVVYDRQPVRGYLR